VFTIPEIAGLSGTYFISLQLRDASNQIVDRNFYWLSARPETFDWDHSTWYHTPTKTFADYTALNTLPTTELQVQAENSPGKSIVTVKNSGKSLAFGVRLKVTKDADGDEVLPVLWEDNYFALLPDETRRITAAYSPRDLGRAKPSVSAEAWNASIKAVE
jgi:exo-1,4-beta-D-glucosaminidase